MKRIGKGTVAIQVVGNEHFLMLIAQVISTRGDEVGVVDKRQSLDHFGKLGIILCHVVLEQAEGHHLLAATTCWQPCSINSTIACHFK